MATYAVGDIQGCLAPLKCLLQDVAFNWKKDTLWLVGDVVNRGPKSLQVLRFLYRRRKRCVWVLGNHDLHLLAVANKARRASRSDTFNKILLARDRDELLGWLRQQPLIHSDMGYTMVHAGIPPMWNLQQAHQYAAEVQTALQGADYLKFLSSMYGNTPRRWKDSLQGYDRLRIITNYLTRMRFITKNGTLDLQSKGPLPNPGSKAVPWFSVKSQVSTETRIIFGHWASLQGSVDSTNMFATDTGCVWGRQLSMLCLDTGEWHRCDCS